MRSKYKEGQRRKARLLERVKGGFTTRKNYLINSDGGEKFVCGRPRQGQTDAADGSYKTKTQQLRQKRSLSRCNVAGSSASNVDSSSVLWTSSSNNHSRNCDDHPENEAFGMDIPDEIEPLNNDEMVSSVQVNYQMEDKIDENYPEIYNLKTVLTRMVHEPKLPFFPSHQAEWAEFNLIYRKGFLPKPRIIEEDGSIHYKYLVTHETYYVSPEMMENFSKFYSFAHYCGSNITGICKIIPYPDYKPSKKGYLDLINGERELLFDSAVHQTAVKASGNDLFRLNFFPVDKSEPFTIQKFFNNCQEINRGPAIGDHEEVFWKQLEHFHCIYAKDKLGTLFDEDQTLFNLNNLQTMLLEEGKWTFKDPNEGAGLIRSYLYLGAFAAAFPVHTEDCELPSINYLHFGHPKNWTTVAPKFGIKLFDLLDRMARENFPDFRKACPFVTRHKYFLASDILLLNKGIPSVKVQQNAGEFVITFPFAAHQGFNSGFNLAEASNFAVGGKDWIQYPIHSYNCKNSSCKYGDNSNIDIEMFVENHLSPTDFKLWKEGSLEGYHPESINYGKTQKVGQEITNPMPTYHVDPRLEDLDTALRIRRIYRTNAEKEEIKNLDLEVEIKNLQVKEKNFKAENSKNSSKRNKRKKNKWSRPVTLKR